MIIHKLIQGTPEWHAFRAEHFTASDAPAMMSVSKYKTRAQLLHEKATGITQDVDAATQRLFDDGHRFEALARPLAEAIIGDDLYPVVGSDGNLAASFDGLTLGLDVKFEHKMLNAKIADCNTADDLDDQYHIQVQHQMMVCGATRTLFMASKWDENDQLIDKIAFLIEPDYAMQERIKAGWDQFAKDLAEYVPAEVIEKPKAEPIKDLPAVVINATGSITVSNLSQVTPEFDRFISETSTTLVTDEDFVNGANRAKTCREIAAALKQKSKEVITQISSVGEAVRVLDLYAQKFDKLGLDLEKLVKTEKENIKTAAIMVARKAFMDHISALNAEIRPAQIEGVTPDFNGAAKNKRTMASLHDAIDTELARVKIESDAQAKGIRLNLALLKEHGKGYEFLFNDLAVIAHKESDDFIAVVSNRIASHKVAEAQKLEAERLRIQAEEEAKARAKVEAEQREATRIQEQADFEAATKIKAANKAAQDRVNEQIAKGIEAQIQASAASLEPIDINHPAVYAIETESSDDDSSPDLTETVLIIRSAYKPEFIRKMVADSLEKYGIEVDSVEIEGEAV